VVDVKTMDEKAIRQYLSQPIESEGYTILSDAFDLLLQLSDLNLSKIMGELQKLNLYGLETKTITRDAVQELVPKSLE
ncbi:DNA polymerase III subunit delta, partial [Enterococcus faecalis]